MGSTLRDLLNITLISIVIYFPDLAVIPLAPISQLLLHFLILVLLSYEPDQPFPSSGPRSIQKCCGSSMFNRGFLEIKFSMIFQLIGLNLSISSKSHVL